jgi:hypothetical protein
MIVLVKGYKPLIGNTDEIYVCDNLHQVKKVLRDTPPDAGGFVQYSTEEIVEVPDTHKTTCPHCGEKFNHPTKVKTLS